MGNPYKYESSWKTEEILTSTNVTNLGSGSFLMLNQTTPQRVINDAPHFDGGLKIPIGQKLIMDGD